MDISKASNYERLAFDILGCDGKKTAAYMSEFAKIGTVSLADYGVDKKVFEELGFESGSSMHGDRLDTIKQVYEKSGMVIDPHTADGVFVGRTHKETGVPMICMATALAVKFEDTIREALGFVPERSKRFAEIEKMLGEDAFTVMNANAESLKSFISANAAI